MKKNILVIYLLFIFSYYSISAQVSFGKPELINDGWNFILSDSKDIQTDMFNGKKWQNIDLPHDWSVKEQLSPTLSSCTGYLPGGIGWYRKFINIPTQNQGQKVYLYFEGVYNRSEVFINGQSLGKRPNGYISFMYDATPYIKYGQENTISVRVDHSQSADSRWYTGSGVYRNVWMVYADPVHIAQWGVFIYPKQVNSRQAILSLSVELENNSDKAADLIVVNELFSPEGKSVAKNSKKISVSSNHNETMVTELKVNNPLLWNLDDPKLYTLQTKILKNGKTTDETTTITGIRTYTFDPDKGFALNGKWMKVKGVCIHHDAGVLGSAVPREVWERRLLALKEIGCNAIRTSHNPQSPDLYDLCDKLGLLVMNEAFDEWEFPKRKWISGWNKGIPGFQGAFDYFEEWGEKDLEDMIRRDRNHTSIFAWSIGNEVDYPNDPYSHPILNGHREGGFTQPIFGGYKQEAPDAMRLGSIAKKLATVVRLHDPSRPVTAGLAGVAMSNETEYPSALDIAGYNYTENRYESDHKTYPSRVIYGSENRHDLKAWKSVRDKDHIFGQFLWTGIDYLGESGEWPSRGFYSGLLDFGGNIKPRGYFRKSLWNDKPMVYLGTYPTPGLGSSNLKNDVWSELEAKKEKNKTEKVPSMDAWPIWNYQDGQSIRVVCYTNTAKAKLLLNGQIVGETKNYEDNTGIIYWDIPYKTGRLEVIGMNNEEQEITTYAIQSSKQPSKLSVMTDKSVVDKNKGLIHVMLQIVDENDIPVMISDNEVTCKISGPAKLLGLENSNNTDMSDYTDNLHRVFNGQLVAYVQATGQEGDIKIEFTSPWLQRTEIVIEAK